MSNLDKALAIAKLGIKVLPVKGFDTSAPKTPYNGNGCSGASTDESTIRDWFTSKYPNALVGYTGAVVLDIDKGHDSGKDGFFSLDENGIEVAPTFSYRSNSGGEHHIYKAVEGYLGQMVDIITPQGVIIEGCDRKGIDNTYAIWWGDEVPETVGAFSDAPEWLLRPLERNRVEWTGTIEEWLETLTDEPMSYKMYQAVAKFKFPDFRRKDMLAAQWAIVNEHAKGEAGAKEAIDKIYSEYVQGKWDTPEDKQDFYGALVGAIQKAGGGPEKKSEPVVDHLGQYFTEKGAFIAYDFAQGECGDLAVDGAGCLWSYSNGVWSYDDNAVVQRLTTQLKGLYKSAYKQPVDDIVRHGLGLPEIDIDRFSRDTINLKNGVYNWTTGLMGEHNDTYLSTVQLPFDYDASATCPEFDNWLDTVVPHSKEMVWEAIGYALMNGNPFNTIYLLVGSGRNGKSTFLRLLEGMIGSKNVSSVTLKELTENAFGVANLHGKLANIAGDIFEPHMKDSTVLKQMSGNDTMYAQRKYGQPFSFKPWALNIFSTNRMWSSSDTTDGYIRRWLPIPFTVRLEEDPNFTEAKLHTEYAGIFNKAMKSLRILMERGKFERSHEANMLLAEFTEASDGIIQFLNDGDFVEKHDPQDVTYSTPKSLVYESYVRYTGGKGLGREKFYNSLEEKGFKIGSGGRRSISGISLTPMDVPSWTDMGRF